ncbi:MAG: hypothetical protein CL678_02635 [Bdellovibrionaceae bacterium]|nr:hypothetical protein [Pseudobdellovibrionaceae bacterium]|tara:strand:+ start:4523 stop:4966 length:444 start_codon:yes stop_codon:yes gene_type:complete
MKLSFILGVFLMSVSSQATELVVDAYCEGKMKTLETGELVPFELRAYVDPKIYCATEDAVLGEPSLLQLVVQNEPDYITERERIFQTKVSYVSIGNKTEVHFVSPEISLKYHALSPNIVKGKLEIRDEEVVGELSCETIEYHMECDE